MATTISFCYKVRHCARMIDVGIPLLHILSDVGRGGIAESLPGKNVQQKGGIILRNREAEGRGQDGRRYCGTGRKPINVESHRAEGRP